MPNYFQIRPVIFNKIFSFSFWLPWQPEFCMELKSFNKVKKEAKIRKRYNQVPYLTQDTTWESYKNTINITNKSQEVNPFPAGDHKAAMDRRKSMRNTRHKKHKWSTKDSCEPQELDVDFVLCLYTLYVVKGRTVTSLLHKLFLGELHRYYSGYNLVRIPFE